MGRERLTLFRSATRPNLPARVVVLRALEVLRSSPILQLDPITPSTPLATYRFWRGLLLECPRRHAA